MKKLRWVAILFAGVLFFTGQVLARGPWVWGGRGAPPGYSSYLQAQGTIVQVKSLPGPGRHGYPWNVIEVKDASGKVYTFAIGPQWWGVPPDLKPGVSVKAIGFLPPGWAFRGVPYHMLCSVTVYLRAKFIS